MMHNEVSADASALASADATKATADLVSSPVKTAVMTRMRHTTTTVATANTTIIETTTATNSVRSVGRETRSPLRLQVPEDGLGNLSMVDAPAT